MVFLVFFFIVFVFRDRSGSGRGEVVLGFGFRGLRFEVMFRLFFGGVYVVGLGFF